MCGTQHLPGVCGTQKNLRDSTPYGYHLTSDSFVLVKRHHPSYFTNVILNFIGFIVLLVSINFFGFYTCVRAISIKHYM